MKRTIQDTKTNEIFTVSEKEFQRVMPTGRYIEVAVEKKASGVAPGAVSTVAGEPAAPSGADTAPTAPAVEEKGETVAPAVEETTEEGKKGRGKK